MNIAKWYWVSKQK